MPRAWAATTSSRPRAHTQSARPIPPRGTISMTMYDEIETERSRQKQVRKARYTRLRRALEHFGTRTWMEAAALERDDLMALDFMCKKSVSLLVRMLRHRGIMSAADAHPAAKGRVVRIMRAEAQPMRYTPSPTKYQSADLDA